ARCRGPSRGWRRGRASARRWRGGAWETCPARAQSWPSLVVEPPHLVVGLPLRRKLPTLGGERVAGIVRKASGGVKTNCRYDEDLRRSASTHRGAKQRSDLGLSPAGAPGTA